MSDYCSLLEHVQILCGLSKAQLRRIEAASTIKSYQAGEVIFEQNSLGREVYIILEGMVDLMVDPATLGTIEKGATQLRKITSLMPGQSFGELALIDEKPRSAAMMAAQNGTKLMMISPETLTNTMNRDAYQIAYVVMNNIASDIAAKTRSNVSLLTEQVLMGYYVRVLCEDLIAQNYQCDTINPLHKTVVIRDADSFVLSGADKLVSQMPEKETLDLFFFSTPDLLRQVALPGDPSGEVIFNALFSLLQTGNISERIDDSPFSYYLMPNSQRRAGLLTVHKTMAGSTQKYSLHWEVKGVRYDAENNTTHGSLFLYLFMDEKSSTRYKVQQIINGIDMPVQKYFTEALPKTEVDYSQFRVLTIHHRSHEVARTLRTLDKLGYQLDAFIGIPYGDVDWSTSKMLDAASNYHFNSLQVITHPTKPISYKYNFAQSSFMSRQDEEEIMAIYDSPKTSGDYLMAMEALALYHFEKALHTARANGERLLIYEDGAYLVPQIYHIYKNPSHRLHSLIKQAIDERLVVGVVEVTTAGERKNLSAIKENNGQALLPVLSSARSDIKTVFEAVGVAEAVIQAGATALGRLGLPTFEMRRIGVIGGNGVVGTRIVEQLVRSHNSTGNIYSVGLSDAVFSLDILKESYPYADNRLKYAGIERYMIPENCFPILLDRPYSQRDFVPNMPAIQEALKRFLAGDFGNYDALALTNSYPLSEGNITRLWGQDIEAYGYKLSAINPFADGKGISLTLRKGHTTKDIILLRAPMVVTFPKITRLINNHIDTVIGITGYSVFNAKDLDTFFARENLPGQDDELVLISASSKDYEFKSAIEFLSQLITLQSEESRPVEEPLTWFANWYDAGMQILQDEDTDALHALLAEPLSNERLQAFRQHAPDLAQRIGLTTNNAAEWTTQIATYITTKINQRIDVEKDIRPDIGSIYHITIDDKQKRVALLADGLVVNFFAKHEKGVRTEYIDPIVTMQMLGLVKLTTSDIEVGLHDLAKRLRPEDMDAFWGAIDEKCRPLELA